MIGIFAWRVIFDYIVTMAYLTYAIIKTVIEILISKFGILFGWIPNNNNEKVTETGNSTSTGGRNISESPLTIQKLSQDLQLAFDTFQAAVYTYENLYYGERTPFDYQGMRMTAIQKL